VSKIYIVPYNKFSKSAKDISRSVGGLVVSGDKRYKKASVIINWGKSDLEHNQKALILNKPLNVQIAKNKLVTFEMLKQRDISIPEFTADKSVAQVWLSDKSIVYVRHLLTSYGGKGIEIVKDGELPDAPLYTKGLGKVHEYRVHVAMSKVIHVSKKKKRNGVESDGSVKNLVNGWVFVVNDIVVPTCVASIAVDAVNSIGLHFGAVDIAYKEKSNTAYVLEINSAPGVEGTTLDKYTKAFRSVYDTNK